MRESLDDRLAKIRAAGIGLTKDNNLKPLISIKSKKLARVHVIVGDQPYLAPYWFSKSGNLCFEIESVLYVKKANGQISMKAPGKDWENADFVTTRAKGPSQTKAEEAVRA